MKIPASARSQSVVRSRIAVRHADKIPIADVAPATDSNGIAMREWPVQAIRQERYTYTGTTNTISAAQLEKYPVTDITKALEGAAPGIQVTSGGGQPGASAYQAVRTNSYQFSADSGAGNSVIVGSGTEKRPITNITKVIEGAAPGIISIGCNGVPDNNVAPPIRMRGLGSMSASNAL